MDIQRGNHQTPQITQGAGGETSEADQKKDGHFWQASAGRSPALFHFRTSTLRRCPDCHMSDPSASSQPQTEPGSSPHNCAALPATFGQIPLKSLLKSTLTAK